LPPATGFKMPSATASKKLRKIVEAAHPPLIGPDDEEFANAFWAVGLMFRTERPASDRYFVGYLADANDLLKRSGGLGSISATAFLSACLAHGDVCWQAAGRSLGVLLAVGLNAHVGRRCSNRWRAILDGTANLLSPVPPPASVRVAAMPSPVRFFQQGFDREMREVSSDFDMWRR
jgi:hypothetical protein